MMSDSKSGDAAKKTADAALTTQGSGSRHVFLLSLVLAQAYLLVIVYASLQPFRNWRLPAADVYGFLSAPWPYYITLYDVLFNVCAYLPLGFMLTLGLRRWLRPVMAVSAGFLLSVALSIAMECVQMYLPARIATNVDVLANGLGALIGSLAAPLFLPSQAIGAAVVALRNRVFIPGALTDIGIVLTALWIASYLNPWAQVFGTGDLRASFDLPALYGHTANRLLSAEAIVVFLNVLGMGLLLSTLLRVDMRRGVFIGGVVILALAMKMLASWLLHKPQGLWAGLTPGMIAGIALAALVLAGMIRLSHRARLATALACVALALVAVNLAPDNPYFNLPPQLVRGTRSHFLNVWSIMQALSELWPLLAITYLSIACWRHRKHRPPPKVL